MKVGVIGCANIAERYMLPTIKNIEDCELTAVASRTMEKANIFANKFSCAPIQGYESLVTHDDIDIIYIPLPTGLHKQWILKALDAGKHVFVEKAFAEDYKSAIEIVDKAKQNNLLVMENYMFAYHSQHTFVKQLIDKGEIGKISVFRSSFGFPPLANDNFRYYNRLGGGALLDVGGYTVKATQMFLGSKLKLQGAYLKYSDDGEVDLLGSAIFVNPKKQIAEVAFGFDNFYQCRYEIWGTTGKITVERAFTPPPDFVPRIILEQQNKTQEFLLSPDNHFRNIFCEFVHSLRERHFQKHWDAILLQAQLIDQIRTHKLNG